MISLSEANGILQTASWNVQQAARRLKLSDDIQRRVVDPMERIQGMVHPVLPDGECCTPSFFSCAIHVLGPAKGGVRITASVSLDEITGLAMEMTWKTSLIGVPFGGGKAGIVYNPALLDATKKEILIRAFTRSAIGTSGRKSTCRRRTWGPTNTTWATSATVSRTLPARRSQTVATSRASPLCSAALSAAARPPATAWRRRFSLPASG